LHIFVNFYQLFNKLAGILKKVYWIYLSPISELQASYLHALHFIEFLTALRVDNGHCYLAGVGGISWPFADCQVTSRSSDQELCICVNNWSIASVVLSSWKTEETYGRMLCICDPMGFVTEKEGFANSAALGYGGCLRSLKLELPRLTARGF
jgi:hypothetical protein